MVKSYGEPFAVFVRSFLELFVVIKKNLNVKNSMKHFQNKQLLKIFLHQTHISQYLYIAQSH